LFDPAHPSLKEYSSGHHSPFRRRRHKPRARNQGLERATVTLAEADFSTRAGIRAWTQLVRADFPMSWNQRVNEIGARGFSNELESARERNWCARIFQRAGISA